MIDEKRRHAHAEYMREWRKRRPEYVEKQKAHLKRFRNQNPTYTRDYSKKWRAEHPEKVKQAMSKYNRKHPDRNRKDVNKLRAWKRVRYLEKGSACLLCGSTENLEVHHLDYAQDVIVTLCRDCHHYVHNYPVQEARA